ncbi:MAG: HAMP domain-containing sensor histidine kinase [Gaiellaceae bacterium]|jgi:signal transduction histidine kinase
MLRSLRFRLPAIFLLGMLVAAVVTAAVAVRFFQDDTESRTLAELRRQAEGLAELYTLQATSSIDVGSPAPRFAPPSLEQATGSQLYYAGVEIFPGQASGLDSLPLDLLDEEALDAGQVQTFELVPPGMERTYLAAAYPIRVGGETFGAIIVAKPRAELQERWIDLMTRLGLASLAGLAIALGLVWYLTRRVTKPVLALSRAADEVAARRYSTVLPEPTGSDEIAHLTERFREMTERLAEAEAHERNFLVRVSHELRTPITAIRGHVAALREGLADDPEATEASLEVIRDATDRLARLVGDLVDLARLEADSFTLEEEEVELRRLVEQGFQPFAEEARRREIRYDLALDGNPVVNTDGDRVLQIVSNLLANAFSWTPDGGSISLALSQERDSVVVAVADSGPGIPADDRDRVFRPFVSENGGGTGLGLAISLELAHALGGDLTLESETGRGSRFELRLPAR